MPDDAAAADIQLSDIEQLDLVLKAISNLPAALKEPLILRTQEGMTQAETAHLLGISEKAVETRVYRARQKLSALIMK